MVDIFLFLLNTFILFALIISPIPALPFVIANYKLNGMFVGFISCYTASILGSLVQYNLGRFFLEKFIKNKKKKVYKKIYSYSSKIKNISFLEIIVLMFQTYIPPLIKHASMGAAKVDLKTFLIACLLVQIPNQFLFIFASFQLNENEGIGNTFSVNEIKDLIISITSSSFIFLIFMICIRITPKLFRSIKNFFLRFLIKKSR